LFSDRVTKGVDVALSLKFIHPLGVELPRRLESPFGASEFVLGIQNP